MRKEKKIKKKKTGGGYDIPVCAFFRINYLPLDVKLIRGSKLLKHYILFTTHFKCKLHCNLKHTNIFISPQGHNEVKGQMRNLGSKVMS